MADTQYNLDHLSEKARRVTQDGATEPAFSGQLLNNEADVLYHCVVCGESLFSSEAKFNSGTGWPSFFAAVDKKKIVLQPDHSGGTERTEVRCGNCNAHLGHVFEDGPKPTGKRFCINSCSLDFEET